MNAQPDLSSLTPVPDSIPDHQRRAISNPASCVRIQRLYSTKRHVPWFYRREYIERNLKLMTEIGAEAWINAMLDSLTEPTE